MMVTNVSFNLLKNFKNDSVVTFTLLTRHAIFFILQVFYDYSKTNDIWLCHGKAINYAIKLPDASLYYKKMIDFLLLKTMKVKTMNDYQKDFKLLFIFSRN